MQFSDILVQIDEQLGTEKRLGDFVSDLEASGAQWSRGNESAEVQPSTSTGVKLRLASRGVVIHERIYAASGMSVPRIVRSITEHLTGYAAW